VSKVSAVFAVVFLREGGFSGQKVKRENRERRKNRIHRADATAAGAGKETK
jgi:hypothetical protein